MVLFYGFLSSKIILKIEEPLRNPVLCITDKEILIGDSYSNQISIYSKENLRLLRSFGRKGEGPGDFRTIRNIFYSPQYIFVDSGDKLSTFDYNGNFLKSIKYLEFTQDYCPMGNNYISINKWLSKKFKKQYTQYYTAISLLNTNLEKIKDLFFSQIRLPFRNKKDKINFYLYPECQNYCVTGDFIIIGDSSKGFYFEIFDETGRKIKTVTSNIERNPFLTDDIDSTIKKLKSNGERKYSEFIKDKNLVFPDFYPSYKFFYAEDKLIYAIGCENISEKFTNLFVIDWNGKLITKKKIPVASIKTLYYVKGKNLYFLTRDEVDDNWILNMENID